MLNRKQYRKLKSVIGALAQRFLSRHKRCSEERRKYWDIGDQMPRFLKVVYIKEPHSVSSSR